MSLEQNPLSDASNSPINQTQDKHILQFNSLGKIMAACADYYVAGKSGDDSLIASLRKDFSERWIIASDRIIYDANSLDATITSYYGSIVVQPFERKVFVPVYSNGPKLDNVLANEQGLLYIQTLFNTNDSADEIKNTLSMLSGKNSGITRIWTPDQGSRKNNNIRVAALSFSSGEFRIDGDGNLLIEGRARGVSGSPVGAALENQALSRTASISSPLEFDSKIDKKNNCVYISNLQSAGKHSKYSGLFCFYNDRFVLSMTSKSFDDADNLGKNIAPVLALPSTTAEKLGILEQEFNPVYAHLQRYENSGKGFILMDDAESFAEPKIIETKRAK